MTSNVSQNYPYSSETEDERAGTIARLVGERPDLSAKVAAETSPVDAQDRWWTWKCPTKGCPGLLHAAGYALEKHAVYVVCDGTCAKTFLR
jgi:hypothetical protein